jgi:hypothetical protein
MNLPFKGCVVFPRNLKSEIGVRVDLLPESGRWNRIGHRHPYCGVFGGFNCMSLLRLQSNESDFIFSRFNAAVIA